ncbi:MAG: hypothetical protein HYW23_03030 [Candidatus Aenigmarchaeota archaeon]|nr:hypothetical protein [Candidatus Aenigmarchaeota archaeon]
MKLKLRIKPAWIGLFLIAVMLLSTFAYAILQSSNTRPNAQLPTSNIVDYRLDSNLKTTLMQYGFTIVTFEYKKDCVDCINQKYTLEAFAKEFNKQIYLEEIVDNSLNKSRVTISSIYGEDSLIDANDTAITSSFCKLMSSPPVACALKQ